MLTNWLSLRIETKASGNQLIDKFTKTQWWISAICEGRRGQNSEKLSRKFSIIFLPTCRIFTEESILDISLHNIFVETLLPFHRFSSNKSNIYCGCRGRRKVREIMLMFTEWSFNYWVTRDAKLLLSSLNYAMV